MGLGGSGRLQLRPTGRRAPASTVGLQTQVREGLLDHRLPGPGGPGVSQAQTVLRTVCARDHLQDRRNDLQLAAAVRAVPQVYLKAKLQRRLTSQVMSQLKTRLCCLARVREAFAGLLAAGPSAAIVGSVRRGTGERAREIFAARPV